MEPEINREFFTIQEVEKHETPREELPTVTAPRDVPAPVEIYPPARMMEIYWNRLHFSAQIEVQSKLNDFPNYSLTHEYWRDVMRILRARVKEVNDRKKDSGNA